MKIDREREFRGIENK
uniref:Uncharacterized protein n=1 Tax=Rhizophora mucronata TaxID=61149 RepID=A0A2P2R573_RHIMU